MFETVEVIVGGLIVVINSIALSTKKSANLLVTILVSLILLGLIILFRGNFS